MAVATVAASIVPVPPNAYWIENPVAAIGTERKAAAPAAKATEVLVLGRTRLRKIIAKWLTQTAITERLKTFNPSAV